MKNKIKYISKIITIIFILSLFLNTNVFAEEYISYVYPNNDATQLPEQLIVNTGAGSPYEKYNIYDYEGRSEVVFQAYEVEKTNGENTYTVYIPDIIIEETLGGNNLEKLQYRELNLYYLLENQKTNVNLSQTNNILHVLTSTNYNIKRTLDNIGSSNGFGTLGISTVKKIIRNSDDNTTKDIEWRFAGYSENLYPIHNPNFPVDFGSQSIDENIYSDRTFIDKPWDITVLKDYGYEKNAITTMLLDNLEYGGTKVKEWYEHFKDNHLKFDEVANAVNPGNEWNYWFDKLQWETDPTKGMGILTGWHLRSGSYYYIALTTEHSGQDNCAN
jgi:hypothetical protein